MSDKPTGSKIVRSLISPRPGDTPMRVENGELIFDLDGYAIIPLDEYHALCGATGFAPDDHWPCRKCGATGPTPEGHDPCIANLPGVEFACCGHGYGHAYAKFDNGVVLRGHFEGMGEPSA